MQVKVTERPAQRNPNQRFGQQNANDQVLAFASLSVQHNWFATVAVFLDLLDLSFIDNRVQIDEIVHVEEVLDCFFHCFFLHLQSAEENSHLSPVQPLLLSFAPHSKIL